MLPGYGKKAHPSGAGHKQCIIMQISPVYRTCCTEACLGLAHAVQIDADITQSSRLPTLQVLAEKVAWGWSKKTGIPLVTICPSFVIGPMLYAGDSFTPKFMQVGCVSPAVGITLEPLR